MESKGSPSIITFNVGGTHFQVARSTLETNTSGTDLLNMLVRRHDGEGDTPIFIDRPASLFEWILYAYKEPTLWPVTGAQIGVDQQIWEREMEYYGVPPPPPPPCTEVGDNEEESYENLRRIYLHLLNCDKCRN